MIKRYTEADVRDALRRYVALRGHWQAVQNFGRTQEGIDGMISGTIPMRICEEQFLGFTRHVEVFYTRVGDATDAHVTD